jgi:3-oxoadipate enol-lactonase
MRNSALDHREWAMLVLVSLIAIGDTGDQLNVYLEAALHQGASVDEIHSAIELACVYVGAPRAVNSARRLALRLQRGETPLLGRGEAIVSVGDHETAVSDTGGDGVPLLLLHSLGLDRRFWRPATARLPAGLRIIAYDLRGHGQARGAPLTTGLEQLAAMRWCCLTCSASSGRMSVAPPTVAPLHNMWRSPRHTACARSF